MRLLAFLVLAVALCGCTTPHIPTCEEVFARGSESRAECQRIRANPPMMTKPFTVNRRR